MEKSPDTILTSLKQMIKHCQDIQALLLSDQQHFSKNNLALIETSNTKKMELLNRLNNLSGELDQYYARNDSISILDRIEQDASKLATTVQQEASHALTELKTEVNKCYQYIATNSQIVFANISHLKDIWDRLLTHKAKSENVYDGKGKISNK